jgi:hypothetical protein
MYWTWEYNDEKESHNLCLIAEEGRETIPGKFHPRDSTGWHRNIWDGHLSQT